MPKRRANGEGNIRKRKDGRWEGRYTAGYDPETGKRIIKNVLGKTQAEVKEKLKTAISESQSWTYAKPLLYNSFIAHPFHWVVGTFQFTRFERAMVVAFPFPTIFGCELPTSGG